MGDPARAARRTRARDLSQRLRIAFAHLGPTYIKLGQIVSGGEGLFPEELVAEFKLLRDRVPPEPFDDVRRVVELELGRSLDDIFTSFDRTPIAAASIAQVHAARLRTGEDVVVKVQRPQIARLVREDIEAMAWLAPHLVGRIPVAALANPPALIELFAETIVEELDFRLEAQNMLDIARVLAETDQRATIVPRPHPTLVTRRVLVMERLDGIPWDDVQAMHAAGVDTEAVLHAGLVSFMEGAMVYGVFHGDLHGGNLMVRPDGRTVLMDFGITGRLDETKRLAFLMLLVGATSGDTMAQLARAARPRRVPARHRSRRGVPRPRSRPHDRPDHALGRRARARAAGPHEEAARVRRPRAEGAHALREEHDVPRRRDRRASHPTSTSSARSRRCTPRSRCATARASRPSSASTRPAAVRHGSGEGRRWACPTSRRLTYREVQERREIVRQRLERRSARSAAAPDAHGPPRFEALAASVADRLQHVEAGGPAGGERRREHRRHGGERDDDRQLLSRHRHLVDALAT